MQQHEQLEEERRGGKGDRELRRVPERLAAQPSHAGGEDRGHDTCPDRRPRDDVGVVRVWPEPSATSAASAALSSSAVPNGRGRRSRRAAPLPRQAPPTPARRPSAPAAAEATIALGVSDSESSITPSARGIRRSGHERRRRPHLDRQAVLRRPRRDADFDILVVDASTDASARGRRRRRTARSGLGAPPARAPRTRTRQQPVDLAVDVRQIDRQGLAGPRERPSRVRVASPRGRCRR